MPKWKEVEAWILAYIRQGLGEGAALPSDAEVAKICGCSVQPVVHAMRGLARRGILERRAGTATIVRALQPLVVYSGYSFTSSAKRLGYKLRSKVIEQARRLPNPGDLLEVERRAQAALGLNRNEPFYVISRIRYLDEIPRVIHHAFLNPAWFPRTFLADHNLESDSLIKIYADCGLEPTSRDTTISARNTFDDEQQWLKVGTVPILDVEQELRAWPSSAVAPVVIEYLHAVYVDWKYKIEDRPAMSPEIGASKSSHQPKARTKGEEQS